jgi:hypothetical protein
MKKLRHYPENGLERKISNEVVTDDLDFNWLQYSKSFSTLQLPCTTLFTQHNKGQQSQNDALTACLLVY